MDLQNVDVIIIGGGVVGLTLASILAQQPLCIALIDQQPPPVIGLKSPYDLRVSAIHHGSQAIFNALGVWQAMRQLRVSNYQRMRVWDANSPAQIDFAATEIAQPYLGHIVEQSVMRQVLWQWLQAQPNVRLYSAAQPRQLLESATHVAVQLADGTTLTGRLLVGADGKDSWVANQAFGGNRDKIASEHALVTTLRCEQPHQQTALQRFLTTGPVALLPLAEPDLVSLVWSTLRHPAEDLAALPEAAFNQALMQAVEYSLGKMQVIDQRVVFPLLRHQVKHYVKARIALVGDAAHTILPLAGQGLNLGLLDAACLAQVVADTLQQQRDIGSSMTLRRYARWRRGENSAMLLAMEAFNRFFSNVAEPARYLRHASFGVAQKLPWLKRYFIQRAMGLRGELPEIARQ